MIAALRAKVPEWTLPVDNQEQNRRRRASSESGIPFVATGQAAEVRCQEAMSNGNSLVCQRCLDFREASAHFTVRPCPGISEQRQRADRLKLERSRATELLAAHFVHSPRAVRGRCAFDKHNRVNCTLWTLSALRLRPPTRRTRSLRPRHPSATKNPRRRSRARQRPP